MVGLWVVRRVAGTVRPHGRGLTLLHLTCGILQHFRACSPPAPAQVTQAVSRRQGGEGCKPRGFVDRFDAAQRVV